MKATHLIEKFEKAGAFFEVEQQALRTVEGIEIPDKVANVRTDTNQVMGVVSPGYKVIPYQQVVETAAASLEVSGINLEGATADVRFAKNGGRMVGVLTFPNEKMLVKTPRGDEEFELQALLRSGHDADFFVDFRPGAVRIACFNGQFIVDAIGAFKGKHTASFSAERMQKQVTHTLGTFKQVGAKWGEWSAKQISMDQAARVLGIYTRQPKEVLNRGWKGLLEQEEKRTTKWTRLGKRFESHEMKEIGRTAYGVYNTMTWDATHAEFKDDGKEATSVVLRHANVNRVLNDRFWTKQLQLAA